MGLAGHVPPEVGIFVVWSNIADTVGNIPNDQAADSYAVMGRTCAGASRPPDPNRGLSGESTALPQLRLASRLAPSGLRPGGFLFGACLARTSTAPRQAYEGLATPRPVRCRLRAK